ncbi:unnamed protein product [Rhizophagus irregularis]|uniref:PAC1-like LisH-like dimerisation domain-containing protein n=1 Tax=Rhizophagus irregularis TaxID=588596 RepID=A0A916E5P8_9GLOM|nr:unnamed protein product [Rhizophagus irregularis]
MATILLSDRQKDELHKAILDYLHSNGYTTAFDSLKAESKQDDFNPDPKQKYAGLLEKKWTSVIRLQKKIMDLENKITQMQEELNNAPIRKTNSAVDWVPQDTSIKIWDYETGDFERTLKGHTKSVQDIAFDPKGNFLVSCSADLTIKVWDLQNDYKCVKTLYGHDHSVSSVAFLPSGDIIILLPATKRLNFGKWHLDIVSNDQTSRLWEVSSGECVDKDPKATSRDQPIPAQYIVTGSRDKTIKIWDSTGQCVRTLVGHDNWVRGLVFHPTGKYLLSGSDDKTIKIWDMKTGRCTKTLEAHAHFVTCIAFNTGSPVVATGSVDQTVKIWAPYR